MLEASSLAPSAAVPADDRCCPRLPAVLSVLVCGHGKARLTGGEAGQTALQNRLATLLGRAFACAQEVFEGDTRYAPALPARLRVITGANDGADQAAIAAARSLDVAQLTIIAPSRMENASGGTERHLLFDFPGEQLSEAEAHALAREARGQLALAHADLVVAVWDGEGGGSTVHLVRHAALARKPVVWINPRDLAAPHLLHRASLLERHLAALQGPDRLAASLRTCFRPFDPAEFRREVQLQLAPVPAQDDGATELDDLFGVRLPGHFLRERAGAVDALLWHLAGLQLGPAGRDFLRLLFGAVGGRAARRLAAWWRSARSQPCGGPRAEAPPQDPAPDALFAWTDEMATLMAGRHRASAWIIALFGAGAVLCAVLGTGAHGAGAAVSATAELLVLLVLIGLLLVARRGRWHRRWLFCRFVAEQLRLQAMLEPLLGTAPAAMRSPWRSTPEGLRFADAGVWVVQRWLAGRGFGAAAADAVVRLDPGSATPLRRFIAEQTEWLRDKRHQLERQHRNLERLSAGLFLVAFVVVVVHFLDVVGLVHWHLGWQLVATAFLPAAGAAVASVLNQAEVQRVAHGYGHSAQRLQDLADAVSDEHHRAEQEKPGSHERWLHLMQVRRLGLEAGRLMAEENQAWYDLMLSRIPALP